MNQNTPDDYKDYACPSCDRSFDSEIGLNHHHSRTHGSSLLSVTLECEWCGGEFEAERSKADTRKLCSKECRVEYTAEKNSGSNSHFHKGVDTEHECGVCGDTFERYPSNVRAENGPFCSRDCYAEYQSKHMWGQNNPSWKEDKHVGFYQAVRRQLDGDSWEREAAEHRASECYMCGDSESVLDVHHIVPVLAGGTNEEYNYLTLCRSCHRTTEHQCRQIDGFNPILTESGN